MGGAISGRFAAVFALVCGLCFWSPGPAWAGSTALSEYQLKAAMLSHFSTFVEWPRGSFAQSSGRFALCVLGRDPFGAGLERTFKGRTVGGREVEIHRSTRTRDLEGCHLLFVSSSERKRVLVILRALAGKNILTVSDMERFVERGGMIQLDRRGSRVQFEINRTAIEQARLDVSAKLLKLASNVHSARRGD